jgi:hypothetical protein
VVTGEPHCREVRLTEFGIASQSTGGESIPLAGLRVEGKAFREREKSGRRLVTEAARAASQKGTVGRGHGILRLAADVARRPEGVGQPL